jgi:hypothetical protein
MKTLDYIKYKHYLIDKNKINKIFSIFNECINILIDNKISYSVAGSIALILNTNKIYRNVKDIDIAIYEPFSIREVDCFRMHQFQCMGEGNRQNRGSTFYFNKNDINIDFFYQPIHKEHEKFVNKIHYNNLIINVDPIEIVLEMKHSRETLHLKDQHDIEFYTPYITPKK